MPTHIFKKIYTGLIGAQPAAHITGAIEAVKERLDVEHEYDILKHPRVQEILNDEPDEAIERIIVMHYKPVGSWDPIPLSNTQIDQTIEQWECGFPDLFNLEINMINFADYGGTLEQLIGALTKIKDGKAVELTMPETRHTRKLPPGKRIFASVLNSDMLGGPGKHWTTVFIDLSKPHGTVEFFNSSGNPPYPEILMWQGRFIRAALDQGLCTDIEFVPVSNIKHQRGPTECGVYSLFYIWSRLNGRGHEFFKKNEIRDHEVTKFRKSHLFIDPEK